MVAVTNTSGGGTLGSSSSGGAVYDHGGSFSGAIFTNCTFTNNSTDLNSIWGAGGAVSVMGLNEFYDCHFEGNSAYLGGAICTFNSPALFSNCTIIGNISTNLGGAFYCKFSGQPVLLNCTISGNIAATASQR